MKLRIGKKSGMRYFGMKDLRGWSPCYDPIRYLPETFRGTGLMILDNPEIPPQDRLWVVLRSAVLSDRTLRLFAVKTARRALSRIKTPDPQSIAACAVAERFANGLATHDDLRRASDAASDAAYAAASYAAASYAAADAASDAASDAAYAAYAADAASDAASYAADAASYAADAASDAASDAAYAAYAADAASDAASYASYAAYAAASYASYAAAADARKAERDAQVKDIRELLIQDGIERRRAKDGIKKT